MPISRENRARYPDNWLDIRNRILNRAGNRCETCGVSNHALGGRDAAGRFMRAHPVGQNCWGLEYPVPGQMWWCGNRGEKAQHLKIIRIVLTIAHMDHTPENCADDNLKALCQRCHLRYDAHHHRACDRTKDLFK